MPTKTAKVRVLQAALYWAGEVVFRPLMTSDSVWFDQSADWLESNSQPFQMKGYGKVDS